MAFPSVRKYYVTESHLQADYDRLTSTFYHETHDLQNADASSPP